MAGFMAARRIHEYPGGVEAGRIEITEAGKRGATTVGRPACRDEGF